MAKHTERHRVVAQTHVAKKEETSQPFVLPVERAFVVQLTADATVSRRSIRGRVEHITSSQATHFASVDELLTFMASVLATSPPTPREES